MVISIVMIALIIVLVFNTVSNISVGMALPNVIHDPLGFIINIIPFIVLYYVNTI